MPLPLPLPDDDGPNGVRARERVKAREATSAKQDADSPTLNPILAPTPIPKPTPDPTPAAASKGSFRGLERKDSKYAWGEGSADPNPLPTPNHHNSWNKTHYGKFYPEDKEEVAGPEKRDKIEKPDNPIRNPNPKPKADRDGKGAAEDTKESEQEWAQEWALEEWYDLVPPAGEGVGSGCHLSLSVLSNLSDHILTHPPIT